MKLKDYLAEADLTPAEFAPSIGLHYTTIYDYMRTPGDQRLKRPRAATLDRIVKATGGKVGAEDFYGPSQALQPASGRRRAKRVGRLA